MRPSPQMPGYGEGRGHSYRQVWPALLAGGVYAPGSSLRPAAFSGEFTESRRGVEHAGDPVVTDLGERAQGGAFPSIAAAHNAGFSAGI